MVTIDMKRIREALPERAKVSLKKRVKGNKISLFIECIVRFPSLYEKGTKDEEQIVEQVFDWQRQIIGKENISEFYTEETGSHWLIFLKNMEYEFVNTSDEDHNNFLSPQEKKLATNVFEIGEKVKVLRKKGKNGIPYETIGEIIKFSTMIRRNGEVTANVKYDEDGEDYYHGISTLTKINP